MTADKLTAAGIKTPWPLKMYRRLTCMDASPELRLKWANKAIAALRDLLVQTTNELRLNNRMYTELTDKHTEALMRAEAAEAENERLKTRTNIALAALYRPDCRPDLAWKVLAHTLWEDDQDD